MAETGNIEKLAKVISSDIFKWFKWNECLPKDENWDCVNEHHGKNTHPSDIVYYYDDPYDNKTVYINTDLKSYKKGSITSTSITNALKTLSMSVECANVSATWQDKYLLDHERFSRVIGLLFIYNHDNEYDKELKRLVKGIDFSKVPISESNMVALFDPLMIARLVNIAADMSKLKANEILPSWKDYTFFYPDIVRARRCGDEWGKPATLEALTSPWLIIKHKAAEDAQGGGYIIYYNKSGESVDEFVYLIDAISHYQLMQSSQTIRVRFTAPAQNAAINFEKAKSEYLKIWGEDEARKKQLGRIEPASITHFSTSFNPMEIGMRENV